MDKQLVASLQQAGVDTSAPPLAELALPCSYPPQQQPLECALKQFGGIERLLRDSLSATLRLQSLMNHLPSGSNIEALLQQEVRARSRPWEESLAWGVTSSDTLTLPTLLCCVSARTPLHMAGPCRLSAT